LERDIKTDMICEQHPWLSWPHDECKGPGCPLDAAIGLMHQQIRALQIAVQARESMIISAYYFNKKEKERK